MLIFLCNIAERVRVRAHAVFFVAEGIVIVGLRLRSGSIDKAHHVAVGVDGVVFGCACGAGDSGSTRTLILSRGGQKRTDQVIN